MKHPQAQLVENLRIKNPNVEPIVNHGTAEPAEDEGWPLSSGKPYFHVILSKTHVKPAYQMFIPTKMHPELPSADVPVVLNCCGKTWELVYLGDRSRKRFDPTWKNFAKDNNLKEGDACIFELAECSSTEVKFKVQILRGDFPLELLNNANGQTSNAPIVID